MAWMKQNNRDKPRTLKHFRVGVIWGQATRSFSAAHASPPMLRKGITAAALLQFIYNYEYYLPKPEIKFIDNWFNKSYSFLNNCSM
jgi:hypothetical protein